MKDNRKQPQQPNPSSQPKWQPQPQQPSREKERKQHIHDQPQKKWQSGS
jgi:hypothetical protein